MSNPMSSPSPENRADYISALQVIDEVVYRNYGAIYESTMRELGQKVVLEANKIKNSDSYPRSIDEVEEAEFITKEAAEFAPQAMHAEADYITSYAAEIEDLGEELNEDEELDGTVAYEAERYLLEQLNKDFLIASAFGNDNTELNFKYEASKAITEEELRAIVERYRRSFEAGGEQPPEDTK